VSRANIEQPASEADTFVIVPDFLADMIAAGSSLLASPLRRISRRAHRPFSYFANLARTPLFFKTSAQNTSHVNRVCFEIPDTNNRMRQNGRLRHFFSIRP